MTKYKIGCCFFVNESDELLGIMTDGDIRRLLLKNNKINMININDINTNYHSEIDFNKFIKDCEKHNYIPILDNNKIIGIINLFGIC
jgi:arabinose-5-phosphate isomerase